MLARHLARFDPGAGARSLVVLALLGLSAAVPPQTGRSAELEDVARDALPYDGRFTFTRVRYGARVDRFRRWGSRAWAHDYPEADLNIQTLLRELTAMQPAVDGSRVLDLEDPALFRHPIVYMTEPGFWSVTERGSENLRAYLLKGGLIIFDDFEADQWLQFAASLERAMPEYALIEIGPDHPVFDAFFTVEDIYVPHPLVDVEPRYFGMFEGNDPGKRMMALVNYNADLAEYWEWSGEGRFAVDPTNDAYRLGVNYFIYAMTH